MLENFLILIIGNSHALQTLKTMKFDFFSGW